jgi:O-methyltransferase involved in polyketide biosynthesis
MSTSGPTAVPPPASLAPASTGPRRTPVPRPPALFDPSIAHPARVYAFWLGGKDHYPADREAGREVVRLRPEVLAGARANRAFGQRVTRYAATAGIRQFLDIGAGLPAPGPTHQIAHGISPACRTVYADNDPLVTAHCRALLAAEPDAAPCACIDADVRDAAALLDGARAALDFTQPVAVLVLAVLHFLADSDNPGGIIRQLAAALAPGSLIAVSHVTADYAPDAITDSAAAYNARVPLPVHPRSREQFAAILGDLPLRHPGIVPVSRWQPSLREPAPQDVDIYGAVAQISPAAPRPALVSVVSEPAPKERPDAAAVAAEVARRAAQFPEYDISCEATLGGPCYLAQGRSLATHPYLVMASDPGRLFAALDANAGPS